MINKLKSRDFPETAVESVVSGLAAEGLQSDERFTESYIHHRIERGYGPLRIRRELQERGVGEDLIEAALESLDTDWQEVAARVREKKFGSTLPPDFKEQSRQSRFLQYRGFSGEQIHRLFRTSD
ncbi:MAG: regulatory protein RecX [Gammaproteobacteria bacterium]